MLKSKIETQYEKHDCSRVCQGDILRDFKFSIIEEDGKVIEISFPYIVILSQDCDLEQRLKEEIIEDKPTYKKCNSYLPNILFIPAFPSENLKTGVHLEEVYFIIQDTKGKDLWKPIKNNNNERYHFLSSYNNFQIPDLVIDFKLYQTIPISTFIKVYNNHYLASVNELFREDLSHRFTHYLSRVALPETNKIDTTI